MSEDEEHDMMATGSQRKHGRSTSPEQQKCVRWGGSSSNSSNERSSIQHVQDQILKIGLWLTHNNPCVT